MTDNREVPAFPLSTSSGSNVSVNGLTKREWFAGMSLMGIRAAGSKESSRIVSEACYCDADAMLTANKEKT